ncbi:lytic transglycosylase domain-containing protein [Undibacterium terreum]|nr:lytic transglycosylase domain-containing protein [Undibacterium terreum]
MTKAFSIFAKDTKNGFITTIHHLLMILGVAAITALGLMFIKPDLAEKFKALSPFTIAEEAAQEEDVPPPPSLAMLMATSQQTAQASTVADKKGVSEEDSKMLGTQRQQQWVTNWLAKRYRVAGDATDMLVSAAYLTAKEIKLDPLLILSVMAIESGLNPFAESPVGAQGLMQVMSKVHQEKFEDLGGIKAALNPVANIKVGALILKDYVSRGGSVEAGLKLYVGAAAFENDSGYGSRVLAEYRRLKDVATGKNVPTFVAPAAAPRPQEVRKPEAVIDMKTTATELHNPEQVAKL